MVPDVARSVAIPRGVQMQWACAVACFGGLSAILAVPAIASAHGLEVARTNDHVSTHRVAVLPVQGRSTLPDSLRTQLRGTIERGLQRANVEIVSDVLVDGEPGAERCDDARCAGALAEALGATWIVRSTITRADAVYEVRLAAIDGDGRTLASADERCEICGHDEMAELVVDRSAALAAKVWLLQRHAPQLALRSRPSGAEVWIDDRLVGHTPLAREVEVGEHEVRLELPGYATERRHVTAVAGTQETLELVLLGDPRASRRSAVWRGLGGAALGTGAALLGAGIGLAVIDEREYEHRCNPDPLGHCSQRYDTLGGGIAAMVGGGVLLATGVAALVVARRSKRTGSARAGRWRLDRGLAFAF
jgi:hypothetical protein